MAKFKIGDRIIRPDAATPTFLEVLDIEGNRYILSYDTDGYPYLSVYFDDESKWRLESPLEEAELKMKKEIGLKHV